MSVDVSSGTRERNHWMLSLGQADTVQIPNGSKLQMWHRTGGAGAQLVREPAVLRTIGAAFGADRPIGKRETGRRAVRPRTPRPVLTAKFATKPIVEALLQLRSGQGYGGPSEVQAQLQDLSESVETLAAEVQRLREAQAFDRKLLQGAAKEPPAG